MLCLLKYCTLYTSEGITKILHIYTSERITKILHIYISAGITKISLYTSEGRM